MFFNFAIYILILSLIIIIIYYLIKLYNITNKLIEYINNNTDIIVNSKNINKKKIYIDLADKEIETDENEIVFKKRYINEERDNK